MRNILRPLESAGREGTSLVSGDGAVRRGYPIFAAFVGDYPEQLLVTLIKNGRCPVCPTARQRMGELDSVRAPRPIEPILEALAKIDKGPTTFSQACADAGIKPIQEPFWGNLPYIMSTSTTALRQTSCTSCTKVYSSTLCSGFAPPAATLKLMPAVDPFRPTITYEGNQSFVSGYWH